MMLTPSTFTLDYLSSLKFKELRKLSQKFNVNKKWAKKQELINNLLAIRPEKSLNDDEITNKEEMSNERKWKDGSIVFQDLKLLEKDNEKIDKRLTFIVDKCSRLTFNIPQNKSFIFSEKNENIHSTETFKIPLKASINSTATYEVPKKEPLLSGGVFSKSIIDMSGNDEKLYYNTQNNSKALSKIKNSSNESAKSSVKSLLGHTLNNEVLKANYIAPNKNNFFPSFQKDQKLSNVEESELNILANSYSKIAKRDKKNIFDLKSSDSLIKISQKSIKIKKSKLPTKIEILKSPVSVRKVGKRQKDFQLVPKSPNKNIVQTKALISFENQNKERNNKETECENILNKRKSKTEEILIKTSNISRLDFMCPTLSLDNECQVPLSGSRSTLNKESKGILNKSNIAKKMPDFTKIHQKQFEQMDSLYDYLKKKEERTRKLFGIPFQKSDGKESNNPSTVFRFQSSAAAKLKKNDAEKHDKLRNVNIAHKTTVMRKIPSSKLHVKINDKDQRRSYINGVRTNKRFELQMKLRNA